MEGDAGASRLNPAETEDSPESERGADQTSTAEIGTDQTSTETTDEVESEAGDSSVAERNPSRLGRGWLIGITAALLVLAGGVGTAGYFALRFNQESQAVARQDAAAVKSARDCVAATQALDMAAMATSAEKIIDCSTGDFRSQAILYSSLFVQAYQAANVHVEVSDMRAAAERRHADGSVDVLVALRVKVSNAETQNRETGYRLRVKMVPDKGEYRIAKLDQVAK